MARIGKRSTPNELVRASSVDWDTRYRSGISPWRSRGLSPVVRQYLQNLPRGSDLLEIGYGTGDDAEELIDFGFTYEGIELSLAATEQAVKRLKARKANLIVGDFFTWKPKKRYAVVYEKGVFHGIIGPRRRLSFSRRVATALEPDGLWITVCGSADNYDPHAPRGVIYLAQLVQAVEPFFEILRLEKAKYGLKKSRSDFDAWYGVFRRRREDKTCVVD